MHMGVYLGVNTNKFELNYFNVGTKVTWVSIFQNCQIELLPTSLCTVICTR